MALSCTLYQVTTCSILTDSLLDHCRNATSSMSMVVCHIFQVCTISHALCLVISYLLIWSITNQEHNIVPEVGLNPLDGIQLNPFLQTSGASNHHLIGLGLNPTSSQLQSGNEALLQVSIWNFLQIFRVTCN